MRLKITFILICLDVLLFCCTAVPLEFNANENERIPDPLLRTEGGFDDDFPEADQDSTLHYGLTTDEHKNNSLEDLISEIDKNVEQLYNENELLYHSMEDEDTNFLDVVAQKVTGLHPNSSIERYDRVCGGILEPSESGVIRYKVNEWYDDNEDCTWIIEVPGATKIEFILEKNGFHDLKDYITITSVDDNDTAVLGTGRKLRLRNTEPRGFVMGSRAMVRFTSINIGLGKGFRLRFLKRQDLDTSIEPDGSKCGGVIVGQTGYLNYKLGKDYLSNEGCVWLLYSPGSESIHLQLIEDGFEICCDYISVNTIDPETGLLRNDAQLFNVRDWNQTIESSLLVILFRSDESGPGKGFSLKFHSSGNQLNVKYKYKLKHITMFGTTEYSSKQAKWEGSGRGEQDIFVIASSRITIPDKYYTAIDWKVHSPNGSCLQHTLVVYEALTGEGFAKAWPGFASSIPNIWLETEQFPKSKESDCPDATTIPTKYNEKFEKTFNVDDPVFIIVYKPLFNGNNGMETRFKFDYSRKQFICGGVLEPLQGEYGLISYKEDTYKRIQTTCSWTIEVQEAAGIKFRLEKARLQDGWLEAVSIDIVESSVELSSDGIQTIVMGSRARVTLNSDVLGFRGFRLRYEKATVLPMDFVCGGIVKPTEGDFGVISYKENWKYANDESCVWFIELQNASSIGFILEESGFQRCCDHITVSSTDDEWNESLSADSDLLRSKGGTAMVCGPKAIVRFSSDARRGGTGFRLRFEKLSDWETCVEDRKCGGVIIQQAGVINYKNARNYFHKEHCAWLLHSPNSTSITLNLFWDIYEDVSVYLQVSTIDAKTGTIHNYGARFGKKFTWTIEESMVVIVFKSGLPPRGMGFSLGYSSNGTNSGPEYGYNLCHISELSGKIEYPNSVWESIRSGNNEIFVVVLSLNLRTVDEFVLVTKLNWDSGVFKKANGSCEYGEVSIYSAQDTKGPWIYSAQESKGPSDWGVIERFPNHIVTSSCSDVVTVTAKELSVSKGSMFLVIYKPVVPSKNLLRDESTSFSLTYELDICGGVYIGSSGVIKHKFNERYINYEECVWLIEVPLAESIIFELDGGIFKYGDYITVSSIKPFTGVENKEIVMSPGNRMALVKGPVAIVTFSSDHSGRGFGFRLHFRMKTPMPKEPAFVYQLYHQKLQNQNEFAYNSESNQVMIAAFSTGINLRKRIEVDITAFLPQVNQSCYSDSLLIYDVSGRRSSAVVLTKMFTSADVDLEEYQTEGHGIAFPQNCVSLRETRLQACKNNEQCGNVSISRSLQTGSSFVAIYNSVHATDNLNNRGFALTSQIRDVKFPWIIY